MFGALLRKQKCVTYSGTYITLKSSILVTGRTITNIRHKLSNHTSTHMTNTFYYMYRKLTHGQEKAHSLKKLGDERPQ